MHNHFRDYLLVLTVSFKKTSGAETAENAGEYTAYDPSICKYSIEPLRQTIVLERVPIEIRLFTINQNNLKVLLEQCLKF